MAGDSMAGYDPASDPDGVWPQPKQWQFLANPADIAIGGGAAGSGKSWALLYEPLRKVHIPRFGAMIFRRTYPQVTMEGGLWNESLAMYSRYIEGARHAELTWTFPAGSHISFGHMDSTDYQAKHKGAQIGLLEFDQLEDFSDEQFFFMLSRNRSTCGVPPKVRATCNPDPDSWLAKFLSWWIDQDTGYAIEERSGVLRWFVRLGDDLDWADSREELVARNGPDSMPKSVSFVPSTVYDNPALLKVNPQYLANLKALPYVEMERLLKGNWKVRPSAGKVFDRANFRIVEWEDVPQGGIECRFWDFAATEKKSAKHDPDFTAGTKLLFATDGHCYVLDCVARQLNPPDVDALFYSTTRQDREDAQGAGSRYMVRWEEEPGSAGKMGSWRMSERLLGYDFGGIPPRGGDKLQRWMACGFVAACQAGRVRLVRGGWNEAFLNNLHNQMEAAHNDVPDSASGAFLCLSRETGVKSAMF